MMELTTTLSSPARRKYGAPLEYFQTPGYLQIPETEIEFKTRRRCYKAHERKPAFGITRFEPQAQKGLISVKNILTRQAFSPTIESDERLAELITRFNNKLTHPMLSVMETFNASVRKALKERCEKVDNIGPQLQICLNSPPEGLLKENDIALKDSATDIYLTILEDLKNINGKIEELREYDLDVKLIITNKDRVLLWKKLESGKHIALSSRYDIGVRENEYKEEMTEFSPKMVDIADKSAEEESVSAKTYALLGIYPHLNQAGTIKVGEKTSPDKKATPRDEDAKFKPYYTLPGVANIKFLKDMIVQKTKGFKDAAISGGAQRLDNIKNSIKDKIGSISPQGQTTKMQGSSTISNELGTTNQKMPADLQKTALDNPFFYPWKVNNKQDNLDKSELFGS